MTGCEVILGIFVVVAVVIVVFILICEWMGYY